MPKMVQLCQTNFFLEKITNIIFIYLLATFIVQNFKNSYSGSRVVRMRHFWAQNASHFLNKVQLLSLSSTYWHFSMSKILKTFYSGSRGMRMRHFWVQNGPFAPNFFWKIMNIILIYLLAPSIVQNFKKILSADPKL